MIVLTMDVKSSTEYQKEKRQLIQKILFNLIKDLNQFNDNFIKASMTTGDEIEILLYKSSLFWDVIYHIEKIFQFEYHMGVGVGSVEIVDYANTPSQMYGEAFYRSRKAIEKASKKRKKMIFLTQNNNYNEILNITVSLINNIKSRWTDRQKEIIYYMNKNNNLLQVDVADHFNVTPQAISQLLTTAGYDSIKNGEKFISKILCNEINLSSLSSMDKSRSVDVE